MTKADPIPDINQTIVAAVQARVDPVTSVLRTIIATVRRRDLYASLHPEIDIDVVESATAGGVLVINKARLVAIRMGTRPVWPDLRWGLIL